MCKCSRMDASEGCSQCREQLQNKPHVHAEFIKAWADGATIEYRESSKDSWNTAVTPSFFGCFEWRIKPEPKPDVVYYAVFGPIGTAILDCAITKYSDHRIDKLKITFDGETLELKSAEVLK